MVLLHPVYLQPFVVQAIPPNSTTHVLQASPAGKWSPNLYTLPSFTLIAEVIIKNTRMAAIIIIIDNKLKPFLFTLY